MRSFDANIVTIAVESLTKQKIYFDPIGWISDHRNIALTNQYDDLALFEYERPKLVIGHYFFNSKGRQAITAAKDFLDELFNTCYNINVIKGLTPLTNLGARWMSRKIGFKSYGVVNSTTDYHELFILTKEEHNNK